MSSTFGPNSWFIWSPHRRGASALLPSKFPEDMVSFFIERFTKTGEYVLDPFVGIGSTLIACRDTERKGVGVDIQEIYIDYARSLANDSNQIAIVGDSKNIQARLKSYFKSKGEVLPKFSYCITSPSYWRALERPGFEFNEKCKKVGIESSYEEHPEDLTNITDYEEYVGELVKVFRQIYQIMKQNSHMTVILKNLKVGSHRMRLAWDIVSKLVKSTRWKFAGEELWCQDDVPLQPLSMHQWVSTTCHHYCLHFYRGRRIW